MVEFVHTNWTPLSSGERERERARESKRGLYQLVGWECSEEQPRHMDHHQSNQEPRTCCPCLIRQQCRPYLGQRCCNFCEGVDRFVQFLAYHKILIELHTSRVICYLFQVSLHKCDSIISIKYWLPIKFSCTHIHIRPSSNFDRWRNLQ